MLDTNGIVYLLHFVQPYPRGRHPQHYLGHAEVGRLDVRLSEHAKGSSKARLTQVMALEGIEFVVARTWEGDYQLEKELKKRHRPASLCNVCRGIEVGQIEVCSSCYHPYKPYELSPGDRRCNECRP